ncbi:DsbA family protein [Alphaproteobacteria bacterium]|nr:DsbA family protein [Alphaproteobacteria bacterium]
MVYSIKKNVSIFIKIFFSYFIVVNYAFPEDTISKQEIDKLIYEYIMDNPEVILESVDKLRKKMAENSDLDETYLKENFIEFANDPSIPYMGSDKPKVTIIEFFDYNCGYCKKSLDAVTELLRTEYDLKISFRDYPILSPSSRIAAKAALAARKQEKYFILHSALMNMQGNLNEEKIFSIASELNIDIEKLKIDMQESEIEKIITNNENLARKLNIRGTPTFIINGKLYAGALELNKLRQIINDSLKDS